MFEAHLRFIRNAGYKTIGQLELRDHLSGAKRLNGKYVLLTFDDGYQDFYHDAYPLLKKHGARALVFLIGNHIVSDPGRSFSDAPSNYDRLHRLAAEKDFGGFLSLEQIREMQTTGLVEFGGHTMTHRVSLVSAEISGAYAGQKLKWYVSEEFNLMKGSPLFRMAPDLFGPRFIPNPVFVSKYIQLVEEGKLSVREVEEHLQTLSRGVIEDDVDWQQRLNSEIVDSKLLLESILDQPVISFCWPWGIEGEDAKKNIEKAGYELSFTLNRGSNSESGDAAAINRFSARRKKGLWLFSRLLVFNNSLLAGYYDGRRPPPSPYLSYF